MRGDQAVDDDPVGGERPKGADFIPAHKGAVARDIGGENRGELPFDGMRFHALGTFPTPKYIRTSCEIRGLLSPSDAPGEDLGFGRGFSPSNEIVAHRLAQKVFRDLEIAAEAAIFPKSDPIARIHSVFGIDQMLQALPHHRAYGSRTTAVRLG